MTIRMTRREAAALVGAALVAPPAFAQTELLTRAIPSSGERLPAVGLGTANVFGSGEQARQTARAVVDALLAGGGRLIDTASTYGEAEAVLGDVRVTGCITNDCNTGLMSVVRSLFGRSNSVATHDSAQTRTTEGASD